MFSRFVGDGGFPVQRHPLSFVIEGSDYLSEWFGGGIKSALRLREISPRRISFTVGEAEPNIGIAEALSF